MKNSPKCFCDSIASYKHKETGEYFCNKCVEFLPKENLTMLKEKDPINPPHYKQHPSGIECIQITQHFNFNLGNVIKYIWRAGEKKKGTKLEDLKKALWYLSNEIQRLAKEEKK